MSSSSEQSDRLKELVREARQTTTIAVCSGKGGVGKSNVALNLSILLAAAGNRVAVVDADLGLANLDVLVDRQATANLSHVVAGARTVDEIIVGLPGGVQLVPGASGLANLAELKPVQRARLLQQLEALEDDNDIIVIDCGAGIGPHTLQFALSADTVLVVTTPEPTAVTDGYAVLKVLTQKDFDGKLGLLVNFVNDRHEARETFHRIAGVARQFLGRKLLDAGYLLTDPKVREAVKKRTPFVLSFPRCPASRCLAALATRLSPGGLLVQKKQGFFHRVANWFA
ncbi:MAG: MinD/ParA family protein [Phycisphaerae bacterium]